MADLSIGDLAAIVTVAGVTIYVLGLVGLAIPVYRTFTDDVATAWYAVSLLPRTVVAGQGVRIWVQWTLAITVVLLLLTTLRSEIVSMGLLALVAIALYPWVGYVAFLAYKRREGWLGNTITLVIAYFGALTVAFAVGLSSDPPLSFRLYTESRCSLLEAS